MPSEQCPYGKDICVYCQKPWSRHGCGDVDAQHEREMAALRAERDEALATVTVLREAALKLNDCLYGRCELCSFGGSCLKEEARNILANLPAAVTAWQAQRERERSALEWYADGENYRARLCEKTCSGDYEILSPVDVDHGERARNALGGGDE
jgi:hypothetical protein